MTSAARLAIVAIVVFAMAVAGVAIGRHLFTPPSHAQAFRAFVDHDLDLDPAQSAAIAAIRQRHEARHMALHAEMRRDNRLIADAIRQERSYGVRVGAAIDRSHQTMGEMQKTVVREIFEMRAVLRPGQAAKFDKAVARALNDDGR